jgi:phage terminase small subunit
MRPLNPRQERFAQLVASGMPASRAYREAGYSATGTASETCAAKLLRIAKVASYVEAVRKAAKEKGETAAYLTLEEKRKFLRSVVTTPVGEVNASSPLCQSFKVTKDGLEYKVPDKLRALELDAKLAGEMTEKVEHSASPELAEWLAVRSGN